MVEESVFRTAIGFLDKLGVYDIILPFLLVFTLVFAILEKTKILGLEKTAQEEDKTRMEILEKLPNLPEDGAPVGKDERDNVVAREVGDKPEFDFEPKDHLGVGTALGIINMEHAAAAAGARFGYLLGAAALMEFALVKMVMEEARAVGFTPVVPPVMVKPEVMRKMGKGQFIKEEEAF